MHALSDEKNRPRCERCAIVDVDAHHGNGTEEIVRKCQDSERLLFFSVHLYDHDRPKKGAFQYKFFPGTGSEDDVAHNVINVPIAPMWREREVVRGISQASNPPVPPAEPRQTRQRSRKANGAESGDQQSAASRSGSNSSGTTESSSSADGAAPGAAQPASAPPSTAPQCPPHYLSGTGRLAYRRAIQHRLLPALRAFNPDLIILSTGFDAAGGDVGNARHYTNGTQAVGLDLEPRDFAWTARKVSWEPGLFRLSWMKDLSRSVNPCTHPLVPFLPHSRRYARSQTYAATGGSCRSSRGGTAGHPPPCPRRPSWGTAAARRTPTQA